MIVSCSVNDSSCFKYICGTRQVICHLVNFFLLEGGVGGLLSMDWKNEVGETRGPPQKTIDVLDAIKRSLKDDFSEINKKLTFDILQTIWYSRNNLNG